MRVDGVIVRMNDTRIYHQVSLDTSVLLPWLHMLSTGWHYPPVKGVHVQGSSDIRTEGGATVLVHCEMCGTRHVLLQVPTAVLTDPNKLSTILPVKYTLIHKLVLPD